jgi:two-component system, NtrC family, response regulator PilR
VNVIELRLPPLRERREDLPALCAALLKRIAGDTGHDAPVLSERAMQALAAMELPGNVRELENLLHRAWALHDDGPLELDEFGHSQFFDDLRESLSRADAEPAMPQAEAISPGGIAGLPGDLQGFLDAQERAILIEALQRTRYNRTAAASMLGITLRQIRYRIDRLGIDLPSGEAAGEGDA